MVIDRDTISMALEQSLCPPHKVNIYQHAIINNATCDLLE